MSGRTVRIAPLEGFLLPVFMLWWEIGDTSRPEHVPFPHDKRYETLNFSSEDRLRYGPVLFHQRLVLRIITFTVLGETAERQCVAVYGWRVGPRRRLANGSWSVRVRPCEGGTEFAVAREIRQAIQSGQLVAGNDADKTPVMVLVQQPEEECCWIDGCRRLTEQYNLPEDW